VVTGKSCEDGPVGSAIQFVKYLFETSQLRLVFCVFAERPVAFVPGGAALI
jgi:hypothetical protein